MRFFALFSHHTNKEKTMKVVIARWKDEGYILVAQSNDKDLLERKRQQNEHLNSKIVSLAEWELIQRCQR